MIPQDSNILCYCDDVIYRVCNAKSPISLFSVFVYIWQRSFDSHENESTQTEVKCTRLVHIQLRQKSSASCK